MEKKYISEDRYSKVSVKRQRRSIATVKSRLKSDAVGKPVIKNNNTNSVINKKMKKTRKKHSKTYNIVICIILLLIITVLSRAILKEKDEPFIPRLVWREENTDELSIGIITEDDLTTNNVNNIVTEEFKKYSNSMILKVNSDYSITYDAINSIEKMSETEYVLVVKKDSKITRENIKESIESYKNDITSLYNAQLTQIDNIELLEESKIKITLKEANPYFVYDLQIPIIDTTNMYIKDLNNNTTDSISYLRVEGADKTLLKKFNVTKYKDMYSAVDGYKENNVNMFLTSIKNVETILGKYDYDIKSIRNGSALFIFGNSKSDIFSKKEVRGAIAYSIDRDSVINNVLASAGEKIDLPYVYDNVKYKYDIYAAENLLLTNGYKKVNNIYTKVEDGKNVKLQLSLLINKEDKTKAAVANIIKNNLSAMGIELNVEALSSEDIQRRISDDNYDLVLASVNLNINPNIQFVKQYLNMSDKTNEAIENVNLSTIENLTTSIQNLQNVLSDEIACIGIYANSSYIIYQKGIMNMNNTSYMNIFKEMLTVEE